MRWITSSHFDRGSFVSSKIVTTRTENCFLHAQHLHRLAQPTVSHHLKVLLDAGLLTREKRGVWAYYRAVPETLAALAGVLAPAPR